MGWIAPRAWTDAALALALGYVLYRLMDTIAYVVVDVVAQQFVARPTRDSSTTEGLLNIFAGVPAVHQLTFQLAGSEVLYGFVVVEALAVLLVGLAGYGLWRWRLRRLAQCPHCLSHIPRGAAVCRECSLEVAA
jgi:hypothetical protein